MSNMAPVSSPRHLWVWSVPLVVLLSLVWYKRKRNTLRSDPGGTPKPSIEEIVSDCQQTKSKAESQSVALTSGENNPEESVWKKSIENSQQNLIEESQNRPEVTSTERCIVKPEVHCAETSKSISLDGARETLISSTLSLTEEGSGIEQEITLSSKKILEVGVEPIKAFPCHQENRESERKGVSAYRQGDEVSTTKMKETKDAVGAPVACPKDVKDNVDKVAGLEDKLASLALKSSEEQMRGAERDSANHSPVDAMLASPSMSSYSDEHSEGSSDSGKGCSDVASPPSRTPVGSGSLAGDAEADTGVESTSTYSVYDFFLPQQLVGRLIGRHGTFVHEIKAKTNATIWIKKHPETSKQKICSVEGTPADIDNALALIRERFPPRKYPNVTLEQVSLVPTTTFPLVPDFCQLHLVEGVNNEAMISSLVSPAHMFVQQPYHPSYQYLQRLNHLMNVVYAHEETPNLPDPIEAGNICVAPAIDGWYRAQVVSSNEESQTSEIKFVDYGGYMTVNNSVLRQIRQDFMTLPFQATECYLANIKPAGESGEWSLEALRIVEELTRGQMLLAQVYDYAADGVPLIYLYSSINSQPWMYDPEVVLINQELVARGMADLDDSVVSFPTSEAASLVVAAAAVAAAATGDTCSSTQTTDSTTSCSTAESSEHPKAVEASSSGEVAN